MREHYRGWAGLPATFLQVLERELFVRHNWLWLEYTKSGCVLAQDESDSPDEHGRTAPAWAEVQLDYCTPDGDAGRATARIERTGVIETIASSGGDTTYPYAQYAVTWLREEQHDREGV